MSSALSMNGNPFSPHSDVLNASPTGLAEKWKLVEELKSRGRLSVVSKRYPEARELYSKAIEVLSSALEITVEEVELAKIKSDLAIFYANRSLVELQMNRASEAYDNAIAATCYDETYLKGYWRLGQAAVALNRPEEAIHAYEKALQLEPTNKALVAECEKAKALWQKKQEEELKQVQEISDQQHSSDSNGTQFKQDALPSNTKKHAVMQKSSSGGDLEEKKSEHCAVSQENENTSQIQPNEEEFSSSDFVRGYKVINGKKTSFFHHEQTEEERRLIGDIAPKRIDTTAATNLDNHAAMSATINKQSTMSSSLQGTSAWNKAGTWEERDLTSLAISTLTDRLMQCSYTIPNGSPGENSIILVTKISKLISTKEGGTAHASLATVRGKKRFIFEFSVCVHWEVALVESGVDDKVIPATNTCRGTITFPDVDGTHEIGQAYDVCDYSVDNDTPIRARYLLERFVRDGGLRTVLEKAMDEWILAIREMN